SADVAEERLHRAAVKDEGDPIAAAEVVVNAADADAGALRHVLDGRVVEAPERETRQGRLEDALHRLDPALLLAHVRRASRAPHSGARARGPAPRPPPRSAGAPLGAGRSSDR